jgi:hypothetical protein
MSENDVKILQDEENTEILNTENSSILDPENISKDNKTEKGIES